MESGLGFGDAGTCVAHAHSAALLIPIPRVVEQRDQRQLPGQGENGEDPYAGSTDENTDNEEQPESPDLPVPELPGGSPSALRPSCHRTVSP